MGSFLATFLYFSSSFVSGISKNNQYFVSQDSGIQEEDPIKRSFSQ